MKPLLIIIAFTVPLGAVECPKGTTAYEGTCAADLVAEKAVDAPTPTSNEKSSRHPEPAWQRGEVHADMPPSQTADDENQSRKKADAIAEGKAKAGIK